MNTFLKKIHIIGVFVLLCNQLAFCQSDEWLKYLTIQSHARNCISTGEYDKAKDLYSELYSFNNKFFYVDDYTCFVQCLIILNDTLALKDIMFEIVEYNWFDIASLSHSFYDILYSQSYWQLLDSLVKEKGKKNYFFNDTLAKMAEIDQEARREYASAGRVVRADTSLSKEEMLSTLDKLAQKMNYIDSINTLTLKSLIDTFGFPTWKLLGVQGSYNAWLIAQHAKIEFQEWYLEHYEQAVAENNAAPAYYGYLVDRVRILKRIPQLYGTQFYGGSGDYHPIEDIENLNNRRENALLPPINVNEINVLDYFPY